MERFAIVGFGCAGCHALKAIRGAGCAAAVDVYSDTGLPPYNPMLTTYYVKGTLPYEGMFPFGTMETLRGELDFTWHDQCAVSQIDAAARTVRLSDGRERAYDKILLSSGARAFVPPVGDLPQSRIFAMRNVEDAGRLKEALASGKVAAYVVDFPTEDILGVENVIAIPHLGASTPESEDNCAVMAAQELQDYLENGNIMNSVNLPTLVQEWSGTARICVIHRNIPGTIASITKVLSDQKVNVENMTNKSKGEYAYTVVDIATQVSDAELDAIRGIEGVLRVRYLTH